MLFFTRLVLLSLLTAVHAQLNLTLIASELPACSISCSEQVLPAAGCALTDIQSCLCRNTTLESQLSVCTQTSCNRTEQATAASVMQGICKGAPQQSRSAEISQAIAILSAFALPAVMLRVYSRFTLTEIWWDDWAIIAAGVLIIPASIIGIYNTQKGFGKHVWDVPPENIVTLQELYYVTQILYVLIKNCAKSSILLLYLRIFPNPRFRLLTKISLVWIFCNAFAFSIALILQCVPVDAVWDINVKGKCINSGAVVFLGAGLAIFEDIVIILLPVMELRSLRLSLRKRLGVMFLFTVASFATITSIVRLKYIVDYQIRSLDATWESTDVLIWSYLEDYSAVMCACLMAIRPLVIKWMPFIFGSQGASQDKASYGPSAANRMDSQAAGSIWARCHGSTIGLKSVENGKSWMDGGDSTHEEGRGLEVWVTKSVQFDDESATGPKSADSGKAWMDGDSTHEERRHGLKVSISKSIEADEMKRGSEDKEQH